MTRLGARLAALGLALSLAALPATSAQAQVLREPAEGKRIVRLGAIQAIDSMNPFLAVRVVSTSVHRWMYAYLTTPDSKTLAPSPDLAESWETSADKLTWTFKIRDTKWSDGAPVTAHDAAWTLNKIMTDDGAKTANGPAVENFASVTASDDRTLVITTRKPQASMLELPIPIMPRHVWEKVGDIAGFEAEQYPAVGNGPYIAVEHKKNAYVKLKANPGYWRGAPKIDELHVIFYENPEAANVGLKKGDIDWIGRLAGPHFEALAGDPDIVQWNTQGRRASYLQLNPGAATADGEEIGDGHPALKDPKVRQAIHHAIDKQALVEQVQNGLAVPADGSIVPPMYKDFFWQAEGDVRVAFDPARANEILDDAGYRKGADGIRTMPDGNRKLEMRFSIHTEDPVEDKLAQFLTGWLKDIGIGLTTRKLDSNKFTEETGSTALYDIAISGWSVNPDPEEVFATHLCSRRPTAAGEGGGTESFYCDEEYERLYQAQLVELDRAKRAELIRRMQQKLYTDAPVIALYYPNNLEGYRSDRITSITPIPEDKGILYGGSGYWPVYSLQAVATPAGPAAGGSSAGAVIGIVAGAVVVLGAGGYLLARRRRAAADDRE
ncbi:ABC transporter substrate-binding protein [Planomonospora venezuelensis]|uniref:Peptide/nickel transport system substrate-binding protein n=1 Tax=Planomonospora venezuelensis TaxID=1999 RepID=A0A841D603_PLAVE|nr:ABC transporter substrate-binding protein [Planomonospora venezuelensis]MBB5965661.1 peptide/nickel transport system substrate-binding protein [Planomonospora venezuelensis]GIN02503.1 peptide ABC transporter substrate-binding protein [Planomonospora venezuelensis]